jgi:tRNA-modifying protein YgfZ
MEPYVAMTQGAALVDRSESGKLALTGPGAKEFLNGQVSNEIEELEPGKGCYAALLTHKGKMLADLRVLDTREKETPIGESLLLLCERPALQALFDALRRFKIGFDCELHKRTLERGLLSLIGPAAMRLVGQSPESHQKRAATSSARVPASVTSASALPIRGRRR